MPVPQTVAKISNKKDKTKAQTKGEGEPGDEANLLHFQMSRSTLCLVYKPKNASHTHV